MVSGADQCGHEEEDGWRDAWHGQSQGTSECVRKESRAHSLDVLGMEETHRSIVRGVHG